MEIFIVVLAPDSTEQDQEIVIESQTGDDQQQQQQQQLYQDYLQYKRSTPYGIYPQQSGDYLARYPIWSRFLQQYQPQYQQYYQQQDKTPLYYREQYYRPYGQYEQDIYGQDQQGDYDRVVRDTGSKKDKKIRGGDKLQEQQEKLFEQQQQQQGLYNPYRVPLYSQQYQRVPYQFYGRNNIYEQQQQLPYYYQQQGPYGNQLLNRLMGYPFYQQQQQQYQPYNLPVYTI